MDALEAIFTRRSTRRMKAELPPPELIQKIIEAGRAAPSSSNSQTTHLIVITKREVLSELAWHKGNLQQLIYERKGSA